MSFYLGTGCQTNRKGKIKATFRRLYATIGVLQDEQYKC